MATVDNHRYAWFLPPVNIVLTTHLESVVSQAIASGRYSNQSEVVRDALRQLETTAPQRPPTCADLARALTANHLPEAEAQSFGEDILDYRREIRDRSRNGNA
jgi:putative addiction module CopG family antidote